MPYRSGAKHSLIAFASGLLAIKLLIKKGVFFADEIIRHQFLHLPLEIILVEIPFSVFGTVGRVVTGVVDTGIPAEAVGLVIAYPLFVALVVAVTHTPKLRLIGSYWLGATVITALLVAMSVGLAPDPENVGSVLVYHLQNHTLALIVQDIVLTIGYMISTIGEITFDRPVDETTGVLVAGILVAFLYGALWELVFGHESDTDS